MDVETISMPKGAAAAALREYHEHLKGRLTMADQIAKKAYRELAKGRRLVNIEDAFRVTGVDEKGRPRLAIARADWSRVVCKAEWHQGDERLYFNQVARVEKKLGAIWIRTPAGYRRTMLRAGVPIIPPRFRPDDELRNYYILFEAAWEEIPPVDPFLLKQIHWPFFVILGAWDLTPVERMVFTLNRKERGNHD